MGIKTLSIASNTEKLIFHLTGALYCIVILEKMEVERVRQKGYPRVPNTNPTMYWITVIL